MSYSMRKTPSYTIYTSLRQVNVSNYIPIVKHPIVLALNEKTQLSFCDKVFPGGRHSRYEHSIFVFHFTDELTRHLLNKGCIDEKQARNVKIASFLHDIGHSPFSHSIGQLLGYMTNPERPKTHNDRGVELLNSEERDAFGRTIRDAISLCKGDFESVVEIVAKKAPEASIISHHTLGTDKMGYTLLDCHHTGYIIDKPFFLDMFPYIFYDNGAMGTDEEIVPQVMRLQTLIQEMYINVYFNKQVKKFSRFIEKGVELEIKSSNLSPEEVWDMSEGALIHRLKNSSDESVRELLKRYSRDELYETVAEFKLYKKTKIPQEKVIGMDENFVDALIRRYMNPMNLSRLEGKMCDAFGLPFADILITLSADPKRIVPEDTVVYTPEGQKLGTLFNLYPTHYSNLVEKSKDFFALSVHVSDKFKSKLEKEAMREIVEEDVKT